jgi:hypothetical protein
MFLDRNALLEAMKLKTETVAIDDGEVILSEIGAKDLMDLYTRKDLQDEKGGIVMSKFVPALVAKSVIDENGNRLFTDEDAELLEKAGAARFSNLAQTARRLNGLAGDELKK